MMDSRLDRLFILLDTGSNESIRLATAKQLGEVQRVQPNERDYLLQRIKEYSGKATWETRTAAGHATRCVLENVEAWPPSIKQEAGDDKSYNSYEVADKLTEQNVDTEKILRHFDLEKIVSLCPRLLSLDTTEGSDLELVNPANSKAATRGRGGSRKSSGARGSTRKSDKEQLMRQRKLINKELGIAMVDSLNVGVKSTDIVSNDDLQTEYETSDVNSTINLSSNHLQNERSTLQNCASNYEKVVEKLVQANCINRPESNEDWPADSVEVNVEWPLRDITKQYADDLFNPSWEIRHGAAIALREFVRLQGSSAGKWTGLSKLTNNTLNQLWLVDIALKTLSVLALDKFGDFLFDQVIAPVRENAAQLLGCCLAHMSKPNTFATIDIILNMLKNSNWETRHGGILALKYYLNVVDDTFAKKILQDCFDPIVNCLADSVDDVSAEAAAALVPVKDGIIEFLPDKTPKLIKFLWDHLADLDELTTSTSNIVLLLASLVTSSSTHLETSELIKSIPRFWYILSHSSTSVRISVLKALITLLKSQKSTCLSWMPENLMTTALRLIFQRAILENMEEVRPLIEEAWMLLIQTSEQEPHSATERLNLLKSTSQFLNSWLCLIMQPLNIPIDRGSTTWLNIRSDGTESDSKPEGEVYIGSLTFDAETVNQQKKQVTKCRLLGTKLMGALYANLVNDFAEIVESQYAKDTLKYVADTFNHYIKTKSANQRVISGWAVESWACHLSDLLLHDYQKLRSILPDSLVETLNTAIQETNLCYDELAITFTRLQQEARSFVSALREANINIDLPVTNDKRAIYTLNQIQSFCDLDIENEVTKLTAKRPHKTSNSKSIPDEVFSGLHGKKVNLVKAQKTSHSSQKSLSVSVLSSLACAHISWRCLPHKLHLATQPLLDSIEFEEEQSLQDKSIKYLVTLVDILSENPEENTNLIRSLLNQLIDMSCTASNIPVEYSDPAPGGSNLPSESVDSGRRNVPDVCKIILLDNLQRRAEMNRVLSRRQSSINSTASLKRSHSLTSSLDLDNDSATLPEEHLRSQALNELSDVKVRGANAALNEFVSHFKSRLPDKAPLLWLKITSDIKSLIDDHLKSDSTPQQSDLIKNLQLLRIVGQSVAIELRKDLLDLFPDLIRLLRSPNPAVRHHGAQCIGIMSKMMLNDTIELINSGIITLLEQGDDTVARCGAIETIALIIEHLQLDLAPRINMFIIHVLRRMSDQNDQIRLMATHCFGKLLVLMPLNLEKSKDSNETDEKSSKPIRKDDQRFIEQLLDPKKLDNFNMPFKIDADLRSYQQDGLNWLSFLNRFNLHGILCDEMGLGKTLMTICIVTSDHFPSDKADKCQAASVGPSLIVCPSTLTEHWLYEFSKFLPRHFKEVLNPVAYSGALSDRMNLRYHILSATRNKDTHSKLSDQQSLKPVNLVVASYDLVRNDIEFFKDIQWNYCVLDEGHIIKNGKTKLSRAIRLLNAQHRLILSGTPIQNNVTELWSLFDFLMPGFLGSERQFNSRYARPILQSREMKCSTRDLEAGALAMESLHRQVLPFTLRRLKEDVLDDLPPKILQDYYCELSALQHQLYEDFTRSKLCKNETKLSIKNLGEDGTDINQEVKSGAKSHVFQALQYLKNVCNHPKLVLTTNHPQYSEIKKDLDNHKSTLDDISHSSKLKALKQLLIDCGIGASSQFGEDQQPSLMSIQSVVNQHRALVFCQLRSMVDIIENDLLKKHLPTVTYLKLDGSVPVKQRQSIVSRFNNDPSIDILLLTTQIGGLGLNLTGADTVIFVEHDWNPTKDLQAMDRAHRIGQKKVVNVYRLITKGTLEEKIMGLQKFKTMVSNTVINQDNGGLETMNVDQLFDLFEEKVGDNSSRETAKPSDRGAGGRSKSAAFLDLLPELWDQQQYETEYDLSNFVSSLKK